jgi:glycogen debranching enzyme
LPENFRKEQEENMKSRRSIIPKLVIGGLACFVLLSEASAFQEGLIPAFLVERDGMTIERPARPGAYFDKVGRRFAILGYESGAFEAWAYPLKILRNFELSFLLRGSTRPIAARDIVRFIEVTPAATTITYTWQTFTVKATFVTAIEEPGAVIFLDIDATEPVTVVAGFLPVLQPMWPAGIGGQYAYWDDKLKAYLISEPTRRNHGFVGSPAAQGISYTPAHMLSDTPNEFTIAVEKPAEERGRFIPIVLAGGKGKREDIRAAYEKIAADPQRVYLAALEYYRNLRQSTLRVETPVPNLNLALEWAKVALDNLRVSNPDLGNGLVAGLGASGTGGRPGFGWFFGVDADLNSLSLSSYGAFDAAKEAIAFMRKWQREDGKMPHELSQAAGYVDWFKDYPYGYIHADTTPFYIVAVYDYYGRTGDLEFVRECWPSLRRAYDWCLTTDADGDGLMDNSKAGLGALEFGSLTGIQTDIYLAAVWTRAALGMAKLAWAMGEEKIAAKADADYRKALAALESKFWDAEAGQYAYGFMKDGKLVKELTPWCAMPLFWKMGPEERAFPALEKMCGADLMTDWGVRILSTRSALYEPLNYNYGAVWPFLGGYAAVALYNYDFLIPGYELVLSNAGHMFDDAAGASTELFSGALHVWPQEAVAHQGFSTTGFVLPFVRGMLGLDGNAAERTVTFAPKFPGDWQRVAIENFRVGPETFSFNYERVVGRIGVDIDSRPGSGYRLLLAPVLAPGTVVRRATLNGREHPILVSEGDIHSASLEGRANPAVSPGSMASAAAFMSGERPSMASDSNIHLGTLNGQERPQSTTRPARCVQPIIEALLTGKDRVEIEIEPAFEILPPAIESRVGDFDRGLKVIRQELHDKTLTVMVEGLAGQEYSLGVLNADLIAAVTGAELKGDRLIIRTPPGEARVFLRQEIVITIQ